MPARDVYDFMVYESIEPFGDRRGDIQAAMICAMLANCQRSKTTDKIWAIADFMPEWERKPEVRKTPEQQLEMMLMIQGLQNGRLTS